MTAMIKIAFLANGGPHIGMGHITRCIAIADELRRYDCSICFLSTAREGIMAAREHGYAAVSPLRGAPAAGDGGISGTGGDFFSFLDAHRFDLLIVDSYGVSYAFLAGLKKRAGKLAYIDDLNAFAYPADILINGNSYVREADFQKHAPEEILLLGARYCPLRREFRDLPFKEPKSEANNILITSGGSDPYGICRKIAEMLLSDAGPAGLKVNIAAGKGFTAIDDLYGWAARHPAAILCREPESMSALMLGCDVAISSAGSTLYELCACGTPALSYIMADNQARLSEDMDRRGLIKSMGRHDELEGERVLCGLKLLMADRDKRAAVSRAMRRTVDGYGAERLAAEIMKVLA